MLQSFNRFPGRRRGPAQLYGLGVLVVLAATVAGCASAGSSSTSTSAAASSGAPSVNVALIADESGPFAQDGLPYSAGVEAEVKSVNASGKLHINLTTTDSQSTPAGALTAAQQAVAGTPNYVLAGITSQAMASAQSTFASAKIPVVAGTILDQLVVPTPAPWFFSENATSTEFATYMVSATKTAVGGSLTGKHIAVDGLVDAAVDQQIASVTAAFQQQGASVVVVTHDPIGMASFASQAASIAAKKPDATLVLSASSNVQIAAKALSDAGVKAPVLAEDSTSDPSLFSAIALPNFYAVRVYNIPSSGDAAFAAAQKYGVTQYAAKAYFARGWSDAMLVAQAAEKCGAKCTSGINALNSLGTVSPAGDLPIGPVDFSASHHDGLTEAQLFVWSPAKQEAVPDGPQINLATTSGS